MSASETGGANLTVGAGLDALVGAYVQSNTTIKLDPAVITYLNQVQQQIQQNAITPAVNGVKQLYNHAFHYRYGPCRVIGRSPH